MEVKIGGSYAKPHRRLSIGRRSAPDRRKYLGQTNRQCIVNKGLLDTRHRGLKHTLPSLFEFAHRVYHL